MATISVPSTPKPRSVTPSYDKVVGTTVSPFTYAQKVFRHPGKMVTLEYDFPPMTGAQFGAWMNFLDDLDGGANTFNVDLSAIFPGTNFEARTSVAFRLDGSSVSFVQDVLKNYRLSFRAIEALTA